MKKALISEDNIVVDVVDKEFEVHESCTWVDCPDDTKMNMVYADGTFTAPTVTVTYVDQRMMEYPSITDQLDKIYHEGLDAWKADIKAVKDKYPKE